MRVPRSMVGRSGLVIMLMALLPAISLATTQQVGVGGRSTPLTGAASSGISFVQSRWEGRDLSGDVSAKVEIVEPDGTDLRTLLTPSEEFNTYSGLAWSRDGSKVAFAHQSFHPGPGAAIGSGEVVIMNADGTGQHVLGTCDHIWCGYGVTWSPDGTRIAYQYKGIRLMDADGTHDRAIWDCSRGACLRFNGPLSWSPDGSWIAFAGEDRDDVGGVFMVPATGGTPHAVTRCYSDLCYGGDRESNAAWSPDGSMIAFTRERNLFVVHPDGSGLRKLSNCPTTPGHRDCTADYPAWSPDGRVIAFTDGHAIFEVDAGGGIPRQVFEAPQGRPEPTSGTATPRSAAFRQLRVSYSVCCLSWQPGDHVLPLATTKGSPSPTGALAPPIRVGIGDSIDAADWPQFGGTADHSGLNPAEDGIGPGTVTSLRETWRSTIGDEALLGQSPVVVADQLFVGGFDGNLYAFRAHGCGSRDCAPEWSGATGGAIRSTPAVGLGTVFVGSSAGLFAFPASGCGWAVCRPLWRGDTGAAAIDFSSPTLVANMVYVGTGSPDSRLYAFDGRGCGAPICAPLWIGTGLSNNGIWSAPAVSGGFVYVRGMDPYLYAFSAGGCGRKECDPLWKGLAAREATEAPSAPVVASGLVFVGSGDCEQGECGVYAFEAGGCSREVCDPLWFGATRGGVGAASALAAGTLFVTSWDGMLYAFDPLGCGRSKCDPLWTGEAVGQIGSTPIIANGLVFVSYRNSGEGNGVGAVAAFPVGGCGAPSCKAVWSTTTGGAHASVAAISGGMLFVSGDDRIVHAYGLS